MELLDWTKPLVTYVGALVVFTLFLLGLLPKRNEGDRGSGIFDISPEKLIAVLGALITPILLLNIQGEIDWWISLTMALISLAVLVWAALEPSVSSGTSRKWGIWAIIALFVFGNTLLFWDNYRNSIYGVKIKAMLHREVTSDSKADERLTYAWEQNIKGKFEEKFRATVELERGDPDVSQRLKAIGCGLDPESDFCDGKVPPTNDLDVIAIDVIWPKILAKYAENLEPTFRQDLNKFFKPIVDNNTVEDDTGKKKLVSIPWFIDVGLLFYRPKLLNEYYGSPQPPKTWDELEKMAKRIQDGERKKGKKDFWGFIWQAMVSEALTCNALEWQYSHGGGSILHRREGVNTGEEVDIEESTVDAFERAKKWIWTDEITPKDIADENKKYDEGRTLTIWREGNAAFMRSWTLAYLPSKGKGSKIAGDIGVTLLPRGNGASGRPASTLGGWQLMINADSTYKKKRAAIKFVKFLTSYEIQKLLATELGKLPALPEMYKNKDPEVLNKLDFIDSTPELEAFFRNPFNNEIVQRPSFVGAKYQDISQKYSSRVREILKNESSDVQDIVRGLRRDMKDALKK